MLKKCPYLNFFWSVFFRIWTEYGEIPNISPYSVRMRENTDQKNSECGQFSRSDNKCVSEQSKVNLVLLRVFARL